MDILRPTAAMQIHFIRHAESEANARHGYFGDLNPSLTPNGRDQAQKLGDYLRLQALQPGYVISSDLERARDTAQIVMSRLANSEQEIRLSQDLREISRGRWTGRLIEEVKNEDPVLWSQFTDGNLDFVPPEGESMRAVGRRMIRAFNDVVSTMSDQGMEHGIIVSHGRAIGALHALFSECRPTFGWRYVIHNTSITTFEYHERYGWGVRRINSTPHLGLS